MQQYFELSVALEILHIVMIILRLKNPVSKDGFNLPK